MSHDYPEKLIKEDSLLIEKSEHIYEEPLRADGQVEEEFFNISPDITNDNEEEREYKGNLFQRLVYKFKSDKKIEDVLNDPDLLDVKNKNVRTILDKGVRVVNSRIVRKTTNLARNVLDITEKIKTGNVISTGAAAITSLELVAEFFDIPKPDHFYDFIQTKGLKKKRKGHLVEMILSPKIINTLKRKPIFEEEDSVLVEVELGKDNFLYMRQMEKSDDNEGQVKYFNQYYIDDNFSYEKAYSYFWKCFNDKIYLTNRSKGAYSDQLRLHSLIFNIDDLLIDEKELNMVGKEISKCHAKNLSRSYLLVGPPGTGKSSFCFVASNKFCPRVLKIDPSVMHKMESGELEFFIEALQPDAIIFDDIDRCDTEGYLLFLLENLKKTFPELVIFATANNFEALGTAIVRPGRFDRVIWVENPDKQERRMFITYYAKRFNLEISDELLKIIVEGTEGFSQAYLIEMLNRAEDDADMDISFKGSMKEFKKTLAMEEECDDDDDYY